MPTAKSLEISVTLEKSAPLKFRVFTAEAPPNKPYNVVTLLNFVLLKLTLKRLEAPLKISPITHSLYENLVH